MYPRPYDTGARRATLNRVAPGMFARTARSVVADVTPLRVSPAYRRLWFGLGISNIGQQMTAVAVAWQVYVITQLVVRWSGWSAASRSYPLVVFGLYGGAIADVVDRRKLMLWTSIGLATMSAVLLAQALADLGSVWLLYLVVALQSAFFAVNNPARASSIPRLVGLELLPAANALQQVTWNLGLHARPTARRPAHRQGRARRRVRPSTW